jgi:hypothetical protein
MDGSSAHGHTLSLAWRCCDCGRLLLFLEPCPSPDSCADCAGLDFQSIGPLNDPRTTYRKAAAQALKWPLVERRKTPRL